jgi:hypothetical protein
MTELKISNHPYQVTFFFTMISLWNLSPINIELLSMLPIYGVHVEFHFIEKYVPYIKNKPKFCCIPKWAKSYKDELKAWQYLEWW